MTTTPQAALLSDDEIDAMANESFEGYMRDRNDNFDRAFAHAVEAAILAKLQATQEPVQTTGPWDHDFIAGRLPRPSHHTTQLAAGADVLDAKRYRWLRRKVCAIQVWNFSGEKVSAAEFEFINLPRLEEVPTKADEALDSAIDAAIAASGRQE